MLITSSDNLWAAQSVGEYQMETKKKIHLLKIKFGLCKIYIVFEELSGAFLRPRSSEKYPITLLGYMDVAEHAMYPRKDKLCCPST